MRIPARHRKRALCRRTGCGWFRQDEPIAAADAPEVSEPVRLSDFVAEEEEAGAKADVDADSSRCVRER